MPPLLLHGRAAARHRVGRCLALGAIVLGLSAAMPRTAQVTAQPPADRCIVPAPVRDAVLNEVSGERAQVHVQMLAANRDRPAEEYLDRFFETTYIEQVARQAGLSDVRVEFFPGAETWDAEEADLWMVAPTRKKLASLTVVPASLAQGSRNADVEAELVYVGQGRETDYAGKDVRGRIVLGSRPVGGIFASAVNQRGAAGALGLDTPGPGDEARAAMDRVGWSSVSPLAAGEGFGFSLSLRQFLELRTLLDRGVKVVLRAHVRARAYPGRMNVVSAAIPGTDPAAGELMLVAHAFETIATPGANDNCSGVGTTLEIGRALARLVRDGVLPRPRRTIRFLWVPEIEGTVAYMHRHPELEDRLLAALNFDMTGANTKTTDTYLRLKMTPDSRASYLNDLVANLLQFVDQTEIRSPNGANAPFNYRLVPMATIYSGSDHSVFIDAGIPALQFNYWPDNYYHSSGDRIEHVDSTELRRVAFVGAASAAFLAQAGPADARALAWEAGMNGQQWIAEVTRQAVRLLETDAGRLPTAYAAARTKVVGAFDRARGGMASVLRLAADDAVAASITRFTETLQAVRDTNLALVDAAYTERAAQLSTRPLRPTPTEAERNAALLVPRRRFKTFSEEARRWQASRASGDRQPGRRWRLPGNGTTEVANFVDGTRSALDIYRAVRAECGNLVTGREEHKFAYLLSRDAPDVELEQVLDILRSLEADGLIEIRAVAPKDVPGKGKK